MDSNVAIFKEVPCDAQELFYHLSFLIAFKLTAKFHTVFHAMS